MYQITKLSNYLATTNSNKVQFAAALGGFEQPAQGISNKQATSPQPLIMHTEQTQQGE